MITSVSLINSSNDFIFQMAEKYVVIDEKEYHSKNDRDIKQILLDRMKSKASDRNILQKCLSVIFCFSVLAMIYGFKKWHTEIQPKQDKHSDLQNDILELQKIKAMQELDIKTNEDLKALKEELGLIKPEKQESPTTPAQSSH